MHSLKELYKFGNGPSSSHTIAPRKATKLFLEKYPDVDFVKVVLYGSLALTGKGHLTDYIIDKELQNIPHIVEFDYLNLPPHPNTMIFHGFKGQEKICEITILSTGGGSIKVLGELDIEIPNVYPHRNLFEIKKYCIQEGIDYKDYVYRFDEGIKDYLGLVYNAMLDTIDRGLKAEGTLHGDLKVHRKAKGLFNNMDNSHSENQKIKRRITAYAYAVSEENASGGEIVTAPTCGAAGVLPSCLRYAIEQQKYTYQEIIDGLAVAGLFGNIVKFTASISGAEAGCQAEVGTACSMAAAFMASLYKMSIDSIEQAAEIALEHHLGLTCDPIKGYVQIPCIERNAVAALRAIDAADMALMLDPKESKISFDLVCKTMLETGKDLGENYRETSIGGLARHYKR